MTPWLEIDGGDAACQVNVVPPGIARITAPGLTLPLLTGLSSIQRPLSIPGIAAAPTSNMEATLDNAGAQLTLLWGERPPMRRAVRVATPKGVLFDGIAVGLQLGEQARLSIEAGADRPLSDNVPLRTSAVWGGWRDVRVLPWVWGHVTLTPLQYSDDQRVFFVADHPIQGVDEVKRDDVATDAWAFYNGVDSTGRAVAFVELAMPLAEGERLAVRLRGRMHPDTGRLLQTPAEILHDVLANLARPRCSGPTWTTTGRRRRTWCWAACWPTTASASGRPSMGCCSPAAAPGQRRCRAWRSPGRRCPTTRRPRCAWTS